MEYIDTSTIVINRGLTFGKEIRPKLMRAASNQSNQETRAVFTCPCTQKIVVNGINITKHKKRCEKMQEKYGKLMDVTENFIA